MFNPDDEVLFACSGQSGLSAEGERAYVTIYQGFQRIEDTNGTADSLEAVRGALQAAADFAQIKLGIVASHELVQGVAIEKWRDMKAARARRVA